jgi:hypothetical protein
MRGMSKDKPHDLVATDDPSLPAFIGESAVLGPLTFRGTYAVSMETPTGPVEVHPGDPLPDGIDPSTVNASDWH